MSTIDRVGLATSVVDLPDGTGVHSAQVPPWTLYSPRQRWWFLVILFMVTTSNYFDFNVVSVVLDPIKREFQVSDTKLGMLTGFIFAVLYAVAALPIARWADRGNRRTITTLTLLGWSVMTVACGLAATFGQLLIARMGVAIAEPGAAPPAQSLIADYFPPERRAMAVAILVQCGSAAGYCIGIGFGGYIAASYGWRAAFLIAGIPGIVLAVLVRFTLAEPRTRIGFPSAATDHETLRDAMLRLRRKSSYLWILAGLTSFTIFAYGTSIFLPSFMVRSLNATLEQVSITWGFAVAIAMFAGALIGGGLADRLSRRDIRWYLWLPAVTCAVGAPLYCATLSTHNIWSFIVVDFPAELILSLGYSVAFGAIHAVCGHRRRAVAVAIAYFLIMLVGCGVGPLMAGALSDAFSAVYGVQSLRQSLLIMVTFLIPAVGCFCCASRTMLRDLES